MIKFLLILKFSLFEALEASSVGLDHIQNNCRRDTELSPHFLRRANKVTLQNITVIINNKLAKQYI